MLHSTNWWLALPSIVAAFAFGYLLGSIPFGLLVTRFAGTQDIRTIGSGNIGATNVLRTGRKGLAAATLLGDALKGTAAVLLTYHAYGQDLAVAAALGAFIGHLFPVWLRFKGGKGVATFIGILVAMSWKVALAFGLIWIVVAYLTRYSSLSGLVASAATPVVVWWLDHDIQVAQLFLLLAVLMWFTHRANIMRIVHGTESKIGGAAAPDPKT